MGWKDTIKKESKSSKSWKDTVVDETPVEGDQPSEMLQTLKDMAVVAPQGITTWADEAMAAASALTQQGGGSPKGFSELYEPSVQGIRESVSEARERSPWATTATELGTGIASSLLPAAGFGKLAGAGSMIARGAIEGLGTAEDKLSQEGLIQAGMGAGIGAGGSLISGAYKKLKSLEPPKVRANVLGARTSEFKEIGIKERAKIADDLKKIGLFKPNKVDYDVDTDKFVSKGKSLENIEKPVREKILDRINDATDKIQKAKMKLLGKYANTPVPEDSIESVLDDVSDSFSRKAIGEEGRLEEALGLKQSLMSDLKNIMQRQGVEEPTVSVLEELKNKLSNDVSNIGKNPLIAKTPHQADLYNSFYTGINKRLREVLGDSKYSSFNDRQQKMLTAKADLIKAIASEDAQKTSVGFGGVLNRVANETLGSPESALGMASLKETMDLPVLKQIQKGLAPVIEESPFQGIRWLDPSVPTKIPMKREDASISPEQLIKYRIPRDSKSIVDNKELVLSKLAQTGVNSELLDTITYALNENPDMISDLAPAVMTMFPNIFTTSKYKMFDGKIIDPNDRAKAADDISKNEDMNSIERAKIISRLNKTGEFPEGLV